jgi:hypothetical protein
MKRILKPETKTSKREIFAPAEIAGGASLPASRPSSANPPAALQRSLAARRKSQTDLSNLINLLTEKSTRQNALEKTGNLHDPAAIAEIGSLHIFTRILPQRIAAQETDDTQAEESLTKATNEFVHKHLGPRIRRLAAQTREQVETELTPHFRDRAALIVAIAQSQRVRTIETLSWTATSHPKHGAITHAEGALQAWTAADDFENTGNKPL